MMTTIMQYIRKGKKVRLDKTTKKMKTISRGKPIGIMVASITEDPDYKVIGVGFSRYNDKKEDVMFNDQFGIGIALDRAIKYSDNNIPPKFVLKEHPTYVREQFIRFAKRAEKYFKGCKLPEWFKYYENIELYYFKNTLPKPEEMFHENEEVTDYIESILNKDI
jgi:hypothetical protein